MLPRLLNHAFAVIFLRAVIFFLTALTALPCAATCYTFGIVPQYEQRQLFAVWEPIIEELQRQTGICFTLASAPAIPAFEKEYLKGSYDFAYMNPYHVLQANDYQGYAPIVKDSRDLRGILVVRKDSPIKGISELKGKVVAFPSPNAVGASLLIRADLSRIHHVDFIPLYVKTHSSVYLHVVKGLVEAGGGVQRTLEEQEKSIRDALKIIYYTRTIPSHPITVHKRVPRAVAEKVRHVLLGMSSTEKGRLLISKIPMEKPIPASIDDYEKIKGWRLESFRVEE